MQCASRSACSTCSSQVLCRDQTTSVDLVFSGAILHPVVAREEDRPKGSIE
eukprot:CAMPEP_0178454102 /NCGR_PEP_ID=MMETSP0689_2-20121128/45173_1 /TAXON_ID=160604 /ORGANISM="Amphidinium massartii, Strain CS-259" /LENGTH=50 /DNA_ID=CAMNT_0020080001 /DNA_START=410 /DNA_END=562 /DNA_ORIENTATION=-